MSCALFPGQGSQHIGMGKFLFDNFKVARELFEEAADTLKIDFKKLCFEGPESDLQLTFNTQPALLLVSVASFKVVHEEKGIKITSSAGHSVGEYAAVVCAESLKFSEALKAVRSRGEFMQSAVPVGVGGMVAAMGLTPEQVTQMCQWAERESQMSPLEPANFNAPGQIVCSGSQQLIEWLQSHINKDIFSPPPAKMRLIPLKVSAPFHCSLMKPAEEKMKSVLMDLPFQTARFPIVQNVNAQPVTEGMQLRDNLIRQISAPVRWIESVEKLQHMGETKAIEFGSGTVLNGLVKKITNGQFQVSNMNSIEDLRNLDEG